MVLHGCPSLRGFPSLARLTSQVLLKVAYSDEEVISEEDVAEGIPADRSAAFATREALASADIPEARFENVLLAGRLE